MILCEVATAQNKITLVPATQPLSISAIGTDKVKVEVLSLTFLVDGLWSGNPIKKMIQIESFNPKMSPLFFETGSNGNSETEITFNKEDFDSTSKSKKVMKQIVLRYSNPEKALEKPESTYIHIQSEKDFYVVVFTPPTSKETATIDVLSEVKDFHVNLDDTTYKTVANKLSIKIKKAGAALLNESADTTLNLILQPKSDLYKVKLSLYPNSLLKVTADEARKLNRFEAVDKTIALSISVDPKDTTAVKTGERSEEFHALKIDGGTSETTIKLTDRGIYNPNKPFWVEVGANFDLNDGLQPNNLFTGVFLHKRDIRRFSFKKGNRTENRDRRNLGLFAGVFASKTITDVSESALGKRAYYNNNSLALKSGNDVGVFVDTGTIKKSRVARNIGLFFSPQLRLSQGSAEMEGLHFFISLWVELQWQRITSDENYSALLRSDTLFVDQTTLSTYAPVESKTELDIRSHYLGAGLPVFFKEGTTNVFINPVFGLSNQPSSETLDNAQMNTVSKLARRWKPFYAIQFRLSEEHYGISFTGEVRGLLVKNSKPFVSLAISKKFDLSKLVEFTQM